MDACPGSSILILSCPRNWLLKYKRWSSASEEFLLSKCDAEMLNQKSCLGRGSETKFRLKPVVQRISPAEEHFVDQECRFWSCLLSLLRFLALLVERNRGIQQRAGIIKRIRTKFFPNLWSMILKTELEARKRGLYELLHRIQLVVSGFLSPSGCGWRCCSIPERSALCGAQQVQCGIQTVVPQLSHQRGCKRPRLLEEGRRATPDPRHFQRQAR